MSMDEMLIYFRIKTRKRGKKIYIMDDSLFRECWETLKNKPKLESITKEQAQIVETIYIIKKKKYQEVI